MAKQTEKVTKTYKAETEYSMTVVCPLGRIHIHFDGMHDGRSTYTTDKKEIQDALEANSAFGKKYTMEVVQAQPEANADILSAKEEKKTVTISVSGMAEAKEYLCEHYDFTRTSLRTKTAILAAAKAHNIEFVGI